ncbi:adenosylcobinamide-GDP ribazoletransferase [Ferrimicrobium sp.]|uniref:adenosylcobinamide-GDP ribazoletransferase n=1 Tax=Ferrimicrobium sp. TaxID=2926050 RepID=UPI00261DD747|nr:adenosylcobinamide-GDP ribazoletransferase [Ferrimicrobium sp.]
MGRALQGTRGAIAFMTLLPLGGSLNAVSLVVIPLTGLIVGAAALAGFWLGDRSGSTLIGAVVALTVDAALTRGLHYDAVADTADGLAGFVTRERRLAIMDEPTVGAFAVLALVVVVAVRISSLSSITFPAYLIGFFVLSRAVMALVMMCFPLAKETSMAQIFASQRRLWIIGTLVAEVLIATGVLAILVTPLVMVAVVFGVGCGVGVLALSMQRLAGITGDVVGAVGLVAESGMLLAAAVLRVHG